MAEDYAQGQYYSDAYTKVRDLEEKQRTLKDRTLLIGENLVELKEKTAEDLAEIKKDIAEIRTTLERLKSFIESASVEFSKFAHKEDLDILAKQAKMFQPLEFVRWKDLEKLKKR